MNEPQVIECSWIPERELVGRGRFAGIGSGAVGRPSNSFVLPHNTKNDFQIFSMTMGQVAKVAQANLAEMKQRSE